MTATITDADLAAIGAVIGAPTSPRPSIDDALALDDWPAAIAELRSDAAAYRAVAYIAIHLLAEVAAELERQARTIRALRREGRTVHNSEAA